MSKIHLLLTVLFISFSAQSQEIGIKHYQRKIDTFDFVFPTEPFSPKGLLIVLPDSLYSFGDIQIKKANFPFFSAKNCSIQFESDTVKTVQFSIAGKKNIARYTAFLKSRIPNFSNQLPPNTIPIEVVVKLSEEAQFTYSSRKEGRKTWVTLNSK